MSIKSIVLKQQEWAFTHEESEAPIIQSTSFGPCYVVTFSHDSAAAMAHIDDSTDVETIDAIFERFRQRGTETPQIKVTIFGGWKGHGDSLKWGVKIVRKIQTAQCTIERSKMFNKQTLPDGAVITQPSELTPFFEQGAYIDSRTGTAALLDNMDRTAECYVRPALIRKQEEHFQEHLAGNIREDYPLEEVNTSIETGVSKSLNQLNLQAAQQ